MIDGPLNNIIKVIKLDFKKKKKKKIEIQKYFKFI